MDHRVHGRHARPITTSPCCWRRKPWSGPPRRKPSGPIWRFQDGRYSGCNLFLLKNENALNVGRLLAQGRELRKQPWKIAAMLGPVMLVRYALGLMTLDETLARLGRAAGVKAAAVRSPTAWRRWMWTSRRTWIWCGAWSKR
jgi:hypothetical protein